MTLGIIAIPDRCMKSMTKLDLVTNPLDVMTTLSCHCELNDFFSNTLYRQRNEKGSHKGPNE